MRCPKTGFTPLKIASLVVGGITIIIHITAVAYPEWDGINVQKQSQRIQGYGSIWDLTVTEDSTKIFFYNSSARHLMDTAWKKPITIMATTGIAAGVVGEGFIVLTALLERCTKNFYVHLCANMISVTSILCASFECLMGAILYKYNYTKHEAPKDLNINRHLPYEEHVLRAGFYLECAAGSLFILTSLIPILDIMYYGEKKKPSISPAIDEENQIITGKDKTTREK